MLQKILLVISLTTICGCKGGLLPLSSQQQQQQQSYNSVIPPFPAYSLPVKPENPLQYLTPKKIQPHSLSILQQLQQNQPQPFQIPQSLQSLQPLQQESQLINSYGPAPSGLTSLHVGPTTQPPLPPLLPQSVSQQLTTSSRTLNSDRLSSAADSLNPQSRNSNSNLIEPEIFVPIANATLQAANLLATSLLEATNKNGNTNKDFVQINQDALKDMQLLNKTDLVIIKARKTAYLLPNSDTSATVGHLSYGDDLTPEKIQELYKQRNQLPILYTINQFLFIIKPENINLLNKLV